MENERWIKQTRNEEKREAGPRRMLAVSIQFYLAPAHLSGWQLKGGAALGLE
jgi:hypothetical protein